jgi:acyl carrier protein
LLALGIIDSLKMLKLTTFIETDFGILLDIEHLVPANLESIRAISALVHGLLVNRAAAKK